MFQGNFQLQDSIKSSKSHGFSKSKMVRIGTQQSQDFQALHYLKGQTLKLSQNKKFYIQTDARFLEDIQTIVKIDGTAFTLFQKQDDQVQLTNQQCEELHYAGKLHREANIANINTIVNFEAALQGQQCLCGCKKVRGNKLSMCIERADLEFLGSGVTLFFLFLKGLMINILISVLIYCIFAVASNIYQSTISQGFKVNLKDLCDDVRCQFLRKSSAQYNTDQNLKQIQFILGICLCCIWLFSLRIIRIVGRKQDKILDQNSKTSADSAIKISDLPYGQYEQSDILNIFKQLSERDDQQKNTPQKIQGLDYYGISSIQIIYKMQFCRKLMDKIKQDCKQLYELVKHKNNTKQNLHYIKIDKVQQYRMIKVNLIQNYDLLDDLRKKFLSDGDFRKKIASSTCLIQFNKQEDSKTVLQKFGQQKMSVFKQIQKKIGQFFCPKTTNLVTFRGSILTIQRAPQPSDLLWLNCEKQTSSLRTILIYGVTFLIICLSFCIMLSLQALNVYFVIQNEKSTSIISTILSFVTTGALQIINKLLWVSLYLLLDFEYNHTLTNKIVSLMNKALFATCVNVLILPLMAYGVFNNFIYGLNGLVGFVYSYHITAITVGMLLRLFSPISMIKNIITCIKPFRYKFIRYMRKKYTQNDQEAFRKRLNQFYQGQYFDVAQQYIFSLGNMFHAIFYCHLLPILLLFALAQIFIFFWISKYKMLRNYKIPQLTQVSAFDTAVAHAGLAPMIYGIGILLTTYVQTYDQPQQIILSYPIAAISIAVLSYGNPCDFFNRLTECVLQSCGCLKVPKVSVSQKKQEKQQNTNHELLKNRGLGITQIIGNNNQQKQDNTVIRLQTYCHNSNSLYLLGFENVLKGRPTIEFKDQLQTFCENFLPKQKLLPVIADKIKILTKFQIERGSEQYYSEQVPQSQNKEES